MQDIRLEPHPADTTSVVEETHEPTAKANKEIRESAYDKLALNKLTMERKAFEERTPRKPNGSRRRRIRSIDVLPGPARKAPEPKPAERKAPLREPPRAKLPRLGHH
jgi:hypothetical protein